MMTLILARGIALILLILWPRSTAMEPPLYIGAGGIQLIALTKPFGKIIAVHRGRSIEQILRNPLGN